MRTKVSAGRSSLPWISGLSRFSSCGYYGSLQMSSWPFCSALRAQLLSLISVQAWNESLTAVGFVIWNHCGCKGIKSTYKQYPVCHPIQVKSWTLRKIFSELCALQDLSSEAKIKKNSSSGCTAISTLLCDRGSWWKLDFKAQVCIQTFTWWPRVFGNVTCPLKHNFPNAKWVVLQLLSRVQLFVAP